MRIVILILTLSVSSCAPLMEIPSGATEIDLKTAYMHRAKDRFGVGVLFAKAVAGKIKAGDDFEEALNQKTNPDLQCIDKALATFYSKRERRILYVGAYNKADGYKVEKAIIKKRMGAGTSILLYKKLREKQKEADKEVYNCIVKKT